MAWKDLGKSVFKATYNGWNNDTTVNAAKGRVFITLQYDDTSLSTTSAKVRFKLDRIDEQEYYDMFYLVFYNMLKDSTDKTSVTYYTLKKDWTDPYNGGVASDWPYHSTSFTLTKAAHEKFTIPEFWFCNDGYDVSDRNYLNGYSTTFKERLYNNYNDNGTRESFRSVHSKKSISIVPSITEVGAATAGTISITDNGNNTCTITATSGTAGANDSIAAVRIYYTDGTSFMSGLTPELEFFTAAEVAAGTKSVIIEAPGDFDKEDTTWHIVAKVELTTTSGKTATSASVTSPIKLYTSPILTGIPKISYTKSKITNKEDWTFNWEVAVAGNDNSPVKGYRIKLLKNYQLVPFMLMASGYITSSSNSTSLYFDLTNNSEEDYWFVKIKPSDFDFKKGDTVCLSVQAYTINGANKYLFSTVKSSSHYVVESAGTVRVKVGDTEGNEVWTDGQVFVKVSDTEGNEVWVEADDIMVKVADTEGNEVWVTSE